MAARDADCRQQLCGMEELMPVLYEFQEVLLHTSLILGPVERMHLGGSALLGVLLQYSFGFISTWRRTNSCSAKPHCSENESAVNGVVEQIDIKSAFLRYTEVLMRRCPVCYMFLTNEDGAVRYAAGAEEAAVSLGLVVEAFILVLKVPFL